ncbi:MAG: hypothetical protein KGM43_04860, partial [Planctomycetota bacterium]|nr:hypothetical protein [Planctomycetota bacterium]
GELRGDATSLLQRESFQPRDLDLGMSLPDGRSSRTGRIAAAVAPRGTAAAFAEPGGRVTLWVRRDDKLRRQCVYQVAGHAIACIAVADGGHALAAGTTDGLVLRFDVSGTRPTVELKGHVGAVSVVAFDRDGKVLASGGGDGTVRVWEGGGTTPTRILKVEEGRILALAFAPDGKMLASSADRRARLWSLATGRSSPPLERHNAIVAALAFTGDGRTLATGYGSWVTFWDTASLREREVIRRQSYALRLLASRSRGGVGEARGEDKTPTLGEVSRAEQPLVVQLCRDEQVLREQAIVLRRDAPLALSARLEGDRLALKVNETEVVFQESFPLGHASRGRFSLEWPAAARLERLEAWRQIPPVRSSLLERADNLYALGRPREALELYRAQGRATSNPRITQEVSYKAALCLLDPPLSEIPESDLDAARASLEEVAQQPGERWPILSSCKLMHLSLQTNRRDDAEAIYARLVAEHPPSQIAATVPSWLSAAIVQSIAPASTYAWLIHDVHLVRDFERAAEIARTLHAPLDLQLLIKFWLAQAYHSENELDKAESTLREIFSNPFAEPVMDLVAVDSYAWVVSRRGRDAAALAEIEARLATGNIAYLGLRATRAELMARKHDWKSARDDLDLYFQRVLPGDVSFTRACLVRGFVRDADGDHSGALASWREGYQAASGTAALAQLPAAIQGSLSGALTNEDARIIFNVVVNQLPVQFPAIELAKDALFDFKNVEAALRTMWNTPRGRDWARKIAFTDLSYNDSNRIQMPLTVAEVINWGAFDGSIGREDDEIVWAAVNRLFDDYYQGKLSLVELPSIMTTWMGSRLFWNKYARSAPVATRALLSYVLGRRYQKLGKSAAARSFFQEALADSPPDSSLGKQTRAALETLH